MPGYQLSDWQVHTLLHFLGGPQERSALPPAVRQLAEDIESTVFPPGRNEYVWLGASPPNSPNAVGASSPASSFNFPFPGSGNSPAFPPGYNVDDWLGGDGPESSANHQFFGDPPRSRTPSEPGTPSFLKRSMDCAEDGGYALPPGFPSTNPIPYVLSFSHHLFNKLRIFLGRFCNHCCASR